MTSLLKMAAGPTLVDFSVFSSPPAHVLGALDFDLLDNICNRLVNLQCNFPFNKKKI